MFWNEHADRQLIPFLDKHDLVKLSMVNKQWQGIVSSRYLFSTILSSIKEVLQEIHKTPEIKAKKNVYSSSR